MKKLLVLVVTVLALAGLVTMAYAGQDVYKDSWVHPLAIWMGAHQDTPDNGYTDHPEYHAINTEDGPPFNDTSIADPSPDYTGDSCALIKYNKTKESWSGRIAQVGGSASSTLNLSGCTSLEFKVRANINMVGDVVVSKISLTDSTNTERTSAQSINIIASSTGWSNVLSIPVSGINLSSINKLFGIIMTSDQPYNTATVLEVLLDDIKYVDASSGKVIVTMNAGVVGVSVSGTINFGLVNPNSPYNSAENTTGDRFITVTNTGSVSELFGLNLVNPTGWSSSAPTADLSAGTPLGINIFALYGIFATAAPATTDYQGTVSTGNDVITTTLKDSGNGTYFSNGTAGNGYAVVATESRTLWIGMRTPSGITAQGTQEIIIVVTASAS